MLLRDVCTLAAFAVVQGGEAHPSPADPPRCTAFVFVSPSGSDSNPGTEASPFRTVQFAADRAVAGEVVLLRAGIYREQVRVHVSGSATAGPIIFRSFAGERAVLDGTGLVPRGDGISALFQIDGQSYITVQSLELRGLVAKDTDSTPAGIAITGSGTHLQLLGNHVHGIHASRAGALCGGRHTANAFGIAVYGTAADRPLEQILIQGNELDHLHTGCSESLALNGNVTAWAVRDNRIHHNDNIGIDAIGHEGTSPNPAVDVARNGIIAGNIVTDLSTSTNSSYPAGDLGADGVYVDGGAHIVVEDNNIRRTEIGIEFASEAAGKAAVANIAQGNTICNSAAAGISLGGAGRRNGAAVDTVLRNNRLVANDTHRTGSGEVHVQHHVRGTVLLGNTLYAGPQGLLLTGATPDVLRNADGNRYGAATGVTRWAWQRTTLRTLAAWQAATGFDRQGELTRGDGACDAMDGQP